MKPFLRNSLPVRLALLLRDYLRWRQRQFAAPSPHLIQHDIFIARNFAD